MHRIVWALVSTRARTYYGDIIMDGNFIAMILDIISIRSSNNNLHMNDELGSRHGL